MEKCTGNYGKGLKIPSMYDISNKILDKVEDTKAIINDEKLTWVNMGVSILSDGWKDILEGSVY